MKKITLLLAIAFIALGCEGDRGPQGPPGQDGGLEFAQVFEIQRDLLPENDYSFNFEIPFDEVFESDVVQVYLLEDGVNGENLWTPLPAIFFFDDGTQVVYNFNHNAFEVNVFLTDNFDLSTVPDSFLFNKTFRIVIIPGAFAENYDINSMESVMESMPNTEIIELR